MKCWKCSQEIDEKTQQCLYCGANQNRSEPRTEIGGAMRQLFDQYGCEKVLTDLRIIANGIGDLADDTRRIKRQLTSAADVHLGEMYLKQIQEKGKPDPEFRKLVSRVLSEDAQLSDKAVEEMTGYLDEMIGWPLEQKMTPKLANTAEENKPTESTECRLERVDEKEPHNKRKPHTAIIIAVTALILVITGVMLLNQQNGWFPVPWATPTAAPALVEKEETEVYINTEKGFAGDIIVRAVLNKDKVIRDLTIDASCETPELGGRLSDPEFTKQFIGKMGPFTYGKDGIDSVTGATVTSWSVLTAINRIYGVSMPPLQRTPELTQEPTQAPTVEPTPTPTVEPTPTPTIEPTPALTVDNASQFNNSDNIVSAKWNDEDMTWMIYLNEEDLSQDYQRMAVRLNRVAKMEMVDNSFSWGGEIREEYTLALEKEPTVKFNHVLVESYKDDPARSALKLIREDAGTTEQYENMFKSLLKMMKEKLGIKVCGMMYPSELGEYAINTSQGLEQAYTAMLNKSGYLPEGGFVSVHFSVYGTDYTQYDDRGIWVRWYRSSSGKNKIQVEIQFRQREE